MCLLPSGMHAGGDVADASSRDVAIITKGDPGGISKRGGVVEPASMQVC